MTVKELIESLQSCNENAEVYIWDECKQQRILMLDSDIYQESEYPEPHESTITTRVEILTTTRK